MEERTSQPIEAQASFQALVHDPDFLADPGRHPAIFADELATRLRQSVASA